MISLTVLLVLIVILTGYAGVKEVPTELKLDDIKYNINFVHKTAMAVFPTNKVMADLATAQAILESNLYGKPSKLAYDYNNLFGITEINGTHGRIGLSTKEYYDGAYHNQTRWFSSNISVIDSFQQYKTLMEKERYKAVNQAEDFETAAIRVQQAGYATSPTYAKELINIYNKYVKGLD